MTVSHNYRCEDCKLEVQYLHHPNVDDDPLPPCTACNGTKFVDLVGTKTLPVTITPGNADFADRQRTRLAKRSDEHYKTKGGRDDSIDRQRMQWKREGIIE